jgi:hypothetical protein
VYSLPVDGRVKAKTCRRDTKNDERIFIMDCANCWVRYCNTALELGVFTMSLLKFEVFYKVMSNVFMFMGKAAQKELLYGCLMLSSLENHEMIFV